MRRIIKSLLGNLFTPAVTLDCKDNIEVALMKKNGKTCVNLLNLGGNHSDPAYKNFDRVPPVYNIDICIDYPSEPETVTVEPDGKPVNYTYNDRKIRLTLNELHIHNVIVIS